MSAVPVRDPTRRFAGFSILNGGLDSASAPSLIAQNQYAVGINVTNRGDYLKTRPPYDQLPLTMDAATAARFTGKFQGAEWYDGNIGESCFVVARGGRLFRITIGKTNVVTEITPVLLIQTTADFTIPGVGNTVTVNVSDEAPFTTGETIIIDSRTYAVSNRFLDQLLLTQTVGAGGTTLAGSPVLDSLGAQIKQYEEHSNAAEFIFLFQADIYMIICRNQFKTVFFDGSSARLAVVGEIPPCLFGVYGDGRIWVLLTDQQSYIGGDIFLGPSGSPSLGFRDAILKTTENDFLNEGGTFGTPSNAGRITAMRFLSIQDTNLGLGPLVIGTTNGIFTNNAPIDRTTWKNLTYPIQTISLQDYGPEGPRSCISANGDIWYRSKDGARSFIISRRNFPMPGNTPQSFEVSTIFNNDTDALLFFGSGMLFNNRLIFTVQPHRTTLGIEHGGLVTLNFDLVSSLRRQDQPAWESVWSGLNVMQLIKTRIDNTERGFAFVQHNGDLALWELLTEDDGFYDTSRTIADDQTTITRKAIEQVIVTRSDDCKEPDEQKNLYMGELYVDEVVDNVTIAVQFRPDQYALWTDWKTISICSNVTQCTITGLGPDGTCTIWKPKKKGYAARMTLPQPQELCSQTGVPIRLGYEFQFKLSITGHCRFRKFRAHTKLVPNPMEGQCQGEVTCKDITGCDDDLIGSYNAYGT